MIVLRLNVRHWRPVEDDVTFDVDDVAAAAACWRWRLVYSVFVSNVSNSGQVMRAKYRSVLPKAVVAVSSSFNDVSV